MAIRTLMFSLAGVLVGILLSTAPSATARPGATEVSAPELTEIRPEVAEWSVPELTRKRPEASEASESQIRPRVHAQPDEPLELNYSPVADFNYRIVSAANGWYGIRLDATTSHDFDGEIVDYSWSYSTPDRILYPNETNDPHFTQYFRSGLHTVSLTVTDNEGASQTTSKIVKADLYSE